MVQVFAVDNSGRLLINSTALLNKGVVSPTTYRSSKSKGRLTEVTYNEGKWVITDTLSTVLRKKVKNTFGELTAGYKCTLSQMDDSGMDCARTAVGFTADTLAINEPFIKSSIIKYMNAHYGNYIILL